MSNSLLALVGEVTHAFSIHPLAHFESIAANLNFDASLGGNPNRSAAWLMQTRVRAAAQVRAVFRDELKPTISCYNALTTLTLYKEVRLGVVQAFRIVAAHALWLPQHFYQLQTRQSCPESVKVNFCRQVLCSKPVLRLGHFETRLKPTLFVLADIVPLLYSHQLQTFHLLFTNHDRLDRFKAGGRTKIFHQFPRTLLDVEAYRRPVRLCMTLLTRMNAVSTSYAGDLLLKRLILQLHHRWRFASTNQAYGTQSPRTNSVSGLSGNRAS